MQRRKFVAGNWKMNLTLDQGLELATELRRLTERLRQVDVGVFPPSILLQPVARRLEGSRIIVGAQNILKAGFGAFTGETSADMLAGVGAAWCLVGHSERRQFFGDTDEVVNGKVHDLFDKGLSVILCIGETLEQRQADHTMDVLETQLSKGLEGITPELVDRLVIAYEPVWAIGTGHTATPAQVGEVHGRIRAWLNEFFGAVAGETIRIQYGGSVKPENAVELMAVPDVDGALVGGAALKADSFAAIVKAAC